MTDVTQATILGYTVKTWLAGFPEYSVEKDGRELVRTFELGDVARFLGMTCRNVVNELYPTGKEGDR